MKTQSLLIIFSALAPLISPSPASAQLSVYTAPSLTRVKQTAEPLVAPDVALSAARGEWESFQVVVHAGVDSVSQVNLSVTSLTGAGGSAIGSSNITLYRESYVRVNRPTPTWGGLDYTNKSLGKGSYADALIPFNDPVTGKPLEGAEYDAVPATVESNQNDVFWIDIQVPRDSPAGRYTGSYTVTSDAGKKKGSITLTVWDFTLPLRPSMHSSFGFYTPYNKWNVIELLKCKLMPTTFDPADQSLFIDQWGLDSVNLGFWSGAYYGHCEMDPPPTVAQVTQAVTQFDPSLLIYDYSADEISDCSNLTDDVLLWAKRLHKGGSNQLIVAIPDPALFDDGSGRSAVDIWSVLPIQYLENKEVIGDAISRGQQVWMYSALFQTEGNVPVWEIDFEPVNFRIPGLINQSTDLNGFLYWSVDYGIYSGLGRQIWKTGYSYKIDEYAFPGEGNLFYPGEQAGTTAFCPSMRLKWLRDGVEDYEYVELLKKCGLESEAKALIASVAADWDSWSHDIDSLFGVREQLAQMILENGCVAEQK